MLYKISRGVQHAWDHDLVVGNHSAGKVAKLMYMARIGGFEENGLGFGLKDDGRVFHECDIVGMGTFVITPADMHR